MNRRPNDKLHYRCRLYSSLFCKNVVLITSIAGAQARLSQYLCNMITFESREW